MELILLLKYDVSLQDVRDEPRPDGTTLAGRTQQLMKKIADDIVAAETYVILMRRRALSVCQPLNRLTKY